MSYNLTNLIADRPNKKIYRDGNKTIKVFNEDFSAANVLNEALNLAYVGETGLAVPHLIEVTKLDGKWTLVVEYIEGTTLDEFIKQNPDKTAEYMERFVEIQINMHHFSAPGLKRHKEKMHTKIRQSGLDATQRYELHTRLDSLPDIDHLCHGDLNPSNIVITDKDEAYIIDWAHATHGDPAACAARTFMLFTLKGRDDLANQYLTLFCKKTDTARQHVEKWIPILSASQLVKGKPEERDVLLKWATVVDYE
ncbi:MAG: phosphotransferase [Treponema sp.]|jgi:tRNA A-37 threonylcarbamoyl transferase component Bud32|nr:phosphotransferase [Treponema sp.]